MGLEHGTLVIGWLEQGNVKFRIGCRTHMGEAVRAISDGGVLLVCRQGGCPLGKWNDEASFQADIEALREKLRVGYLEPPLVGRAR
jgi:hypothetical protein